MKDKICPKCSENEIRIVPKENINIGISLGVISTAWMNYYVCTNCGYTELYVQNADELKQIAMKYPKV